jgi:hypothetical protein
MPKIREPFQWKVDVSQRQKCGAIPDRVFGLEVNGNQCWYFLEGAGGVPAWIPSRMDVGVTVALAGIGVVPETLFAACACRKAQSKPLQSAADVVPLSAAIYRSGDASK